MNKVYIGLGSNLGPSEEIISSALDYIPKTYSLDVLITSSLYRSKPLDCHAHQTETQPDYINAVACLTGKFSPLELLELLQTVEAHFGRLRDGQRWASRTLDLDILLFDDLIMSDERLTIPHAGLLQRDFMIYPLMEIAPELEIPGFGSMLQAIKACENRGLEKIHDNHCNP